MLTPILGEFANGKGLRKLMLIDRIATTEKGWTDDTTCYEWFTKTFIPQVTARRENPEEAVVLILDNHASHRTPEMLRAAVANNITFHYLPPHTTHKLQPLDVGVFGPLQRKWQQRCDEIINETNSEVPRSQFVKEYMNVRNRVFTTELVQSAWRTAGIWPLDPQKFNEKDFAPSKLTSYTSSLPPGYPDISNTPDVLVFVAEDGMDEGGNEMDDGDRGDGTDDGNGNDGTDNGGSNGETKGGNTSGEMGGGNGNSEPGGKAVDGDGGNDSDGFSGTNETDGGTAAGAGSVDMRRGANGTGGNNATVRGGDFSNNRGHFRRFGAGLTSKLVRIYSPPPLVGSIKQTQVVDLEKDLQSLHAQLAIANSELKTAVAQNICAGWEIKGLKQQLNSKAGLKKRKVQVNAQYISCADAIQILDEQEREAAEKKEKEEEAQSAKKAKDDQRKQQREAGSITFTGSLNSKTKDDLLDISFALGLTGSDSNTPETRAALISIINIHLDKNFCLASNSPFAGLFLSRTRGRKRSENVPPPALPPTTTLPGSPRQPFSPNPARDPSEPEPPMVPFTELPYSGRFQRPINSTPPNFGSNGPSTPYSHYPPPTSHPSGHPQATH